MDAPTTTRYPTTSPIGPGGSAVALTTRSTRARHGPRMPRPMRPIQRPPTDSLERAPPILDSTHATTIAAHDRVPLVPARTHGRTRAHTHAHTRTPQPRTRSRWVYFQHTREIPSSIAALRAAMHASPSADKASCTAANRPEPASTPLPPWSLMQKPHAPSFSAARKAPSKFIFRTPKEVEAISRSPFFLGSQHLFLFHPTG